MATYAIGDIQGCYRELLDLLNEINFDENRDRLWFTGDIINRGPESLATLRLIKRLNAVTVLGNHDLHLLAVAAGKARLRKKDTLEPLLNAPDSSELLSWLQNRPLIHQDENMPYTLLHAGLPPQWDITLALGLAGEVEQVLRGQSAPKFFAHMYGDQPDVWSEKLQGWDRLRFITNCFTRLRFCDADGRIYMQEKGPPGRQSGSLLPWYQVSGRQSAGEIIIFGHWATIRLGTVQDFRSAGVHALDTGCVWGGKLTGMRLEDEKYFSVPSRQPAIPFRKPRPTVQNSN